MIFEKEKYYKYIQQLETFQKIIYIIIMILAVLIGIATKKFFGIIISILIGMFISWYLLIKIRKEIQEMKWKFDIYNKIMEK